MSEFKEIAATEIEGNIIDRIANEWMLITAGSTASYNTMTASWGFMGEMWGKHCTAVFLRPQRYTKEFVDREGYYTLSFYGDNKDIHKVCGSKTGRTCDKPREAGLTPVFADNSVYFEQANMVIVCKKFYSDDIKEENFTDAEPLKWYPDKDYHQMYIGEIVKVLIKE